MPLSRVQKNCLRSDKAPKAGTKIPGGSNSDVGVKNKQYNHTGKKYTGPNYAQLNLGSGKPITK